MPAPTPAGTKRCSYHLDYWDCPFDAEEGSDLCIFHLPVEQKRPEDFWRHLASYLVALLDKAGNEETEAWREAHPVHRVLREAHPELVAAYSRVIPGLPPPVFSSGVEKPLSGLWPFTGFIFPPMDGTHNFADFVFGPADFRRATFSGVADFLGARFSGAADFEHATFSGAADFEHATFSGAADFGHARFSGGAWFLGARFSGEASFGSARFSGEAWFGHATFSGEAGFGSATFSGGAGFWDATFSGRANFLGATFSGRANFSGAEFRDRVEFSRAMFGDEVDFSFARFTKPPTFAHTGFKTRVDFYEAKVPGLSDECDERDARDIRLLAERHGSYADAGDFYRIEMDFRRKRFRRTPGRWFQYALMELYRFSSCYGESPGRAFVSFLVVLAGFGVLYTLAGFSLGEMSVGRALAFARRECLGTLRDFACGMWLSLVNLLPGNLRGDTLGVRLPTTCGRLIAVFQVVLSYIVLTLFLLAIRRRFRR